jgi:hypothetical protein
VGDADGGSDAPEAKRSRTDGDAAPSRAALTAGADAPAAGSEPAYRARLLALEEAHALDADLLYKLHDATAQGAGALAMHMPLYEMTGAFVGRWLTSERGYCPLHGDCC